MKAKNVPKTKKGAKGISLFMRNLFPLLFLERITRAIPMMAPNQKASTKPDKAKDRPSNQPIPRANLASPKPIHLPPDMNQKRQKGKLLMCPKKALKE